MATRTIKRSVPDKFPPAKLYLDDLGEIVTIFREAVETTKPTFTNSEDRQIEFTFTCAGRQCDTLDEIPSILRANHEFTLLISRGWTECKLSCSPWYFNMWRTSGLSEESAWTAYHQLSPIFERRKRRLAAVVRSVPFWLWIVLGLLVPPLLHYLAHSFEPRVSYKAAERLEVVLFVTYLILVVGTGLRHTSLSARKSHESPLGRTLVTDKIIPGIVIALFSVLCTLLGQHLIHKYWP